MDPYEKAIINALKDGKPRNFQQILDEIGFSHNTLRLHLNSMVDEGLVAREKMPSKGRGRSVYLYSASIEASGASGEVLVLTFSDLKRICRYSRGGRVVRPRPDVSLVSVPKSGKRIKHH